MTLFKSIFSRRSHETAPVVATGMSLDSWCHELPAQPTRFVQKVELCTAHAFGEDAWGDPVGKSHHHTLLRVSLAPATSSSGDSEETLLIERVLSTGGAHHSVTPIAEALSAGGTLFHPDVHDRVCVISDGPPTALVHHLEVERKIAFGEGTSGPHLTLAQLGKIIDFIRRTTMLICAGGDCKFQSRSFAFTCLAALAPSLPPSALLRKAAERVDSNAEDVVDDWEYELGAEVFLSKVPWLVEDPASTRALELIAELKDGPRETSRARLYH